MTVKEGTASSTSYGTLFSINVDENNRSAKIAANGAVTVVPLSDWGLHGYKLYGNEFCQDFFIEMNLNTTYKYSMEPEK